VDGVKIDVAVGEHDAFGVGAGAAGVEKFGDGVFVDGIDVGVSRAS
jgi:hypothetical protein